MQVGSGQWVVGSEAVEDKFGVCQSSTDTTHCPLSTSHCPLPFPYCFTNFSEAELMQ